jgi:endonuclease G
MVAVDLAARPRLTDLRRLGGTPSVDAALASHVEAVDAQLEAARRPRRTPAASLVDRTGYVDTFLGDFTVPLPVPRGSLARDMLPIPGRADHRLDYTHFSVVMSKARRMAMFVAVNIDGKNAVRISRETDRWALDGRIPDEAQIGEELYVDNILDRGHLVRREDPNWGAVADQANNDTFHFTNCSPQAGAFNQRTWLSLESYILDNARAVEDKVTVFTGPVFRSNDRLYRDALIPTAYWKVVAFVNDSGRPSATAYIVDQVEELRNLEVTFGGFKTYQRSVREIERLSKLSFGDLSSFDGFSNEELETGTTISAELRVPGDARV